MMLHTMTPEKIECCKKMDEAYEAGDFEEYRRLDKEYDRILKEQHEKERAEYLEVFGIDIDTYSDYSYKLLDLEAGRRGAYTKE